MSHPADGAEKPAHAANVAGPFRTWWSDYIGFSFRVLMGVIPFQVPLHAR